MRSYVAILAHIRVCMGQHLVPYKYYVQVANILFGCFISYQVFGYAAACYKSITIDACTNFYHHNCKTQIHEYTYITNLVCPCMCSGVC